MEITWNPVGDVLHEVLVSLNGADCFRRMFTHAPDYIQALQLGFVLCSLVKVQAVGVR